VPNIFISYRRDDTSGYAGRLYDLLSAHFGKEHVFMDVTTIEPGSDFVNTIEEKVGGCNALVALIGKNWMTIKDDQGHLRIANPEDFVSVEVAAALRRNVEVVPVLVGGAKMPREQDLPQSLQLLSRRQALELSDVHFNRDADDLIQALKTPPGSRAAQSRNWLMPALAAAGVTLAIAAGIWYSRPPAHPRESAGSPPPTTASATTNLNGNWKAVLQKGDVTFETYFTFEVAGDKLFGKAFYPTGDAGILNGSISQGRMSFITRHTPQFSDEEATFTVEGIPSGDQIQFLVQDKDGLSKGVAHRVDSVGQPKVLTR
jgi:hypothetical protein